MATAAWYLVTLALVYLSSVVSATYLRCSPAHRYWACDQRIVELCYENHERKIHEAEIR
jgi:hypothetical protein